MAPTRSSKNWNDKETQELINQLGSGSNNQNLKKILTEVLERLSLMRDEVGRAREETNEVITETEGLKKNVIELKKQIRDLRKENEEERGHVRELQEEGENWKREAVRLKELERENEALKKELSEIKTTQGEHITALKEVQVCFEEEKKETSKWVEVVRKGGGGNSGKKETISETLVEQTRRESKAKNIVIRGLDIGTSPKEDAEKILERIGASVSFEGAWRIGKDETRNKPLVIKFSNVSDRAIVIGNRTALKGTRIYLDDDLTLMQLEARRASLAQVMEARKEGKWAVYRDGRVIIRERRET